MSASVAPLSTALRRLAGALACAAGGLLLVGCDLTGAEATEKASAQREADGKAIGSACRHAGRAIEDCYSLNPKAQRASVFSGWREMDEYMRENKLESLAPSLDAPSAKADKPDRAEKIADKSADKTPDRSEAKGARTDKRASAESPRAEVTTGKVDLPPRPRVVKHEPS